MFVIYREWNNGYRCSCYRCTHDATDFIEDRDAALAFVSKKADEGECELERIEVRDGASGEVIAEGSLAWVGGRGERYRNFHWFGHKDGKPFDDVHGLRDGESTWPDVVERVHREQREAQERKLTAEIAERQKQLDALKAGTP